MSKLFITQKYYDKFLTGDAKKVIQLYGFNNRDSYFKGIIDYLNSKYPYLNIDDIEIMDQNEASVYSMYNGYVKGDFSDYDEVLVSFSDPYTKEGNTIISQQLMPMLQEKISSDLKFLYNKKIKKIFLLTSHKVTPFDASRNSIKEDSRGSTLQLLVRCLITLGFDVHSFIPIFNLNIGPAFSSIEELISDIEYIKSQNSGNLQHKQIELVEGKVIGSFSQIPKGQDEKYFAIRYLTAIILNKHNKYDVSQAYSISGKSQMMEMLYRFADYVSSNDIILNASTGLSDKEFIDLVYKEDEFLEKLKKLAEKYGEDGTRSITTRVRLSEVQNELRRRLIVKHGCKCMLCNTTNEELLIASHIKPASECDIYGKADPENALLLCATHDKLFDKNFITFSFIDGKIQISNKLTPEEIELCNLDEEYQLPEELLTSKRRDYLIWHNDEFEKKNGE